MLIPQKISFILFLTDGCQQIGYIMLIEKTKKRETKVSRFSYPFKVTMYWVLRICNAYLATLCSVYVQHFCRKIGG